MTLEDWNTVLQFASAVVLGVTFLVGTGALWTSYLVAKRQEERIAKINERAAASELKVEELKQKQQPRSLSVVNMEILSEAVRPFPKGTLTVMYQPGDEEASRLADRILHAIIDGWNITSVTGMPIPETAAAENLRNLPPAVRRLMPVAPFGRMGAHELGGIALISRDSQNNPTVGALMAALKRVGLDAHVGFDDSALGPHDLIVVVGPKP